MSTSKHSSSEYFLTENRWVLKFFAAKSPVHVLLFVIPMMIIMGIIVQRGNFTFEKIFLGIIVGILHWTFIEYLIHRFYFHWNPRNKFIRRLVDSFHIYHHKNPKDMEVINSGPLTGVVGLMFHYLTWLILTLGDYYFAAVIVFGLLIAYAFYEWVHYSVHQRYYSSGIMKFMQEFHLTHHQYPKKNFGQISPIWDYLFKTSTTNKSVLNNEVMKSFIKELRE